MEFGDKSHFCALPFVRRVVAPSGLLRPCCDFSSPYSYTEEDFKKLQTSLLSNERHPHCRVCWEKEDLGIDSLRHKQAKVSLEKVYELELNLSNLCNLKCRMCGSDSSSSWIDDEVYLRERTANKPFRPKQIEKLEKAFKSKEELFAFLDSLKLEHLEKITFFGGEPFLQALFEDVLAYLINKNRTDIELRITTNGTVLPDKHLHLLRQFEKVDYRLSIEAVGDLYRYIRGGKKFSLKDIEINLDLIKKNTNFKVSANCALSAYCAFSIADLYIWLDEHLVGAPGKVHWYDVFDPPYLSPKVLPLNIRQIARKYNIELLRKNNLLTSDLEKEVNRLLQMQIPTLQIETEQFCTFTKLLDKKRGENFFSLLPRDIGISDEWFFSNEEALTF